MEQISQDEIRKVANLSMLTLSKEEMTMFAGDLTAVVGYFERLRDVDTEGVEEIGHITGMQDVYRADEPEQTSLEKREALLANVPAMNGDHISVKNVL